ncbi:response regulator [Tengunoibacter tsumagoiensis]|uniref:Response regulatory domain-containing protein n=1 Tax=Tengunoibacter tsumagoiensis TaxID=2014871 RepID=A0A401ZUB8_9CHLR|nr:response regulator [Tengunoibacter tsumagoiensis]GCE10453.1 hypothetical protein KTT_03120 [Tengunoibacter tsumagoiensis]
MSESKKILLVEDHPMFTQIMQCALELYTPHQILHQQSGDQILSVLSSYQPDLLVLDYNLPGMNGIELYDFVHSTKEFMHLPSLMVSADLPVQEIRRRNLPGLFKPFPVSEFLQAVGELLQPGLRRSDYSLPVSF